MLIFPALMKLWQVKIYMGDGWHKDFSRTHFDVYSPPDFYAKVRHIWYSICIKILIEILSPCGVVLPAKWRLHNRSVSKFWIPSPYHKSRCLSNNFFADFQVEIAGVPADIKTKRTRTRQDDWTPVWGEEFSFPLTVPELALLRIEACEYNMSDMDDFGGQTCLPVWELKPGIRAVPLHDRKGNKYNSVRLLMRFQFVWTSFTGSFGLQIEFYIHSQPLICLKLYDVVRYGCSINLVVCRQQRKFILGMDAINKGVSPFLPFVFLLQWISVNFLKIVHIFCECVK